MIIGTGFAGMWSALSAMRVVDAAGAVPDTPEVVVLAPKPELHVRPRLYEDDLSAVAPSLDALYQAVGVRFIAGFVETIETHRNEVVYVGADGQRARLGYDSLVLASGSKLFQPAIPGLREHGFSVDQLHDAQALRRHMEGLADLPASPARNTLVVAGGGFTGIETAAEMPARMRAILGENTDVQVFIVEQAGAIGPDLGPGPRPVIEQALRELGVVSRLNAAVVSVDAEGLVLSTGERIESKTVVWTAGARANDLAGQVPGERDRLGRLHVSPELRVKGSTGIFATGDAAYAATDDLGNHAMMSCQHAMNLGRSAGHNAAAELLGLPLHAYSQPQYVTCLDLGPWGAVYTEGWEREVKLSGAEAKALKHRLNTEWIYPPRADRAEALAAADPARIVVA